MTIAAPMRASCCQLIFTKMQANTPKVLDQGLDCAPEQSVTVCAALLFRESWEPGAHVKPSIAEQIAVLPSLNKAQLLPIWVDNFHTDPPPKLRKELMVPILAYRIQEREYGGLSHGARKKLQQLARSLQIEKQSQANIKSNLKTGTRLIRSWKGEVHEVSVSGSGYEYRGRQFASLSHIAREITGTRWSGPLFFGTKKQVS
jgi:hypothetical protein